jgi:hypothetical protein
MKKIIFILTIALFSCEKDNPEPITTVQNDCAEPCKCGEITNINLYAPYEEFTYTLKNNCTGQISTALNATYYDYGLDMCLDYCW